MRYHHWKSLAHFGLTACLIASLSACGGSDAEENGENDPTDGQEVPTNGDHTPDFGGEVPPVEECEKISGEITESKVLDGCYHVTNDITISGGGKVEIKPGSILIFSQDKGLAVWGEGRLSALGEDKGILFTGEQETPGYWKGVAFHGTNHTDNELDFVVIDYAGGEAQNRSGPGALVIDGRTGQTRVAVRNSTLRNSKSVGLWAGGDNDNDNIIITAFENNSLTSNEGAAASIRPNVAGLLEDSSTYSGNGKDYVLIHNGNDLTISQTWPALDVPYRVSKSFSVTGDTDFALAPGVTIEFENDAGIAVWEEATFNAEGTKEKSILLTGASKTKGAWMGIAYHGTNSTKNVLDHVTIEYGGGEAHYRSAAANLAIDDRTAPVRVEVRNSTLQHSGSYGFWGGGDNDNKRASVVFEKNTLTENEKGAAAVVPALAGIFDAESDYQGNDQDYVFIQTDWALTKSQTLAPLNVPYRFENHISVGSDALLTIEPGATLVFNSNAGLSVSEDARIKAEGTKSAPIVMTGYEEIPGYWMGVAYHFTNSADNIIRHVEIEYAGGNKHYRIEEPAALAVDNRAGPVRLDVSDTTIRHSGGVGIYIEAGSDYTVSVGDCSNMTYADNAGVDVAPSDVSCPF